MRLFFASNDTATTEIYTLSLHDALPISADSDLQLGQQSRDDDRGGPDPGRYGLQRLAQPGRARAGAGGRELDRKSTRLNSSHTVISYAVFCLKKKKRTNITSNREDDTLE